MQSIETLKTKKKWLLFTFSIKILGAHALNDLKFHGNDKFWDICQNCHSCHLALRPEITIFQRPLLWPSAGTASRVNEICCCTSLTLFICLFVCLFFFFFFTFTWCKGRCLWTTFGKICKILTKKTDLWNFDKGSCKSKAKLPMQIDSAKRILKMVVFSPLILHY